MEQIDCNCTVVTIVVNLNDNFTHTERAGQEKILRISRIHTRVPM